MLGWVVGNALPHLGHPDERLVVFVRLKQSLLSIFVRMQQLLLVLVQLLLTRKPAVKPDELGTQARSTVGLEWVKTRTFVASSTI